MSARPTVAERLKDRVCPNCGRPAERKSAKGPRPTFCSKECKRSHNNRLLVEGRAVIGFLKAWRVDRGVGEIAQKSFAQVCEITDLFNAQDNTLGRVRPDYYGACLLSGETRYLDRQRPRKEK